MSAGGGGRSQGLEPRDSRAEAIFAEQIRMLFRQSSTGTHAVLVLVTAFVLWPVVPRPAVAVWLSVMLGVTALRAAVNRSFRRRAPADGEMRRWARWYVLLIGATGCGWGAGTLLLLANHSFPHQVFYALALGGTALGAVATLSPSMPIVRAALVPSVLPLAACFFAGGKPAQVAGGVMVCFYFAALCRVAHTFNGSITRSLTLRYENAELLRDLATKSSRLQVTIDSTTDGLGVFDGDARLATWNDQFRIMLGLPEEMGRAGTGWGEITRHLGSEAGNSPERRADPHHLEQFTVNGRTIEARMSPTVGGGFVVTCTDVTRHQLVEDALRGATLFAEEASRAKSRFLAAASHDLRQPLHALALFVDALSSTVDSDEAHTVIGQMEKSVAAMMGLFSGILDLSRLDAGVVTPEVIDFPVCRLLEQMRIEFAPLAREKRLDLRVVPSSAFVHSDPILLERIVRNLLANAIRYTDAGRVLVGCRRRGTRLGIEVLDTGPGIPPDRLREVFREFYQLPASSRAGGQGVGLGLAIVERTARLLEHPIDASSIPGRGSRFAIEVPLGLPTGAAGHDPKFTDIAGGDLAGALIVVVDDEGPVRDAMQAMLPGWGCQVVAGESPSEVLSVLEQSPRAPDVIVADYRLGRGTNGIEAVATLRRSLGAEIPALIVTGDTAPERFQEVEAAGLPLLHKPVQPAKLRALLRFLRTEGSIPVAARSG